MNKIKTQDTQKAPLLTRLRSSYRAAVILFCAFIACSTAAILMSITIFIFNAYMSSYATENMEVLAKYTAQRVSDEYARVPALRALDYNALVNTMNLSSETGLMILDSEGELVYTTQNTDNSVPGDFSSSPSSAARVAISQINANGTDIGSVRIWVYGSDALMSKADVAFRNNTVEAMLLATLVALLIAIGLGVWFSHRLVSPIKKITDAANSISEGDLTARTNLRGNSEISQLGKQFDKMADSIESDRQMEMRLTSDVAHELRTPLMAVQATVEAMIDGVYEPDREHLEIIDSEIMRLSHLVDTLLKLSRLEKRSQPLKEEVCDLSSLVNNMVISHEAFVSESGLTIAAHAKSPVKTICDHDLITQAVANLISNAIRYTPAGGRIDVYVHYEMTDEGRMSVIDVADTGIGLTEEQAKMVFARFWRANSDRGDKTGGLGIGLTVVKEIISRHKGEIKVKGEPNVGSTFTIMLPAYDEETARREARDAIVAFEARERLFAEKSRTAREVLDVPQEVQLDEEVEDEFEETPDQVEPIEEGPTMRKPDYQGKVRDIYDLGDKLMLVATDRISAYDFVLPDDIPHKGQVLTQLSVFWFNLFDGVVKNHLITADVADLPEEFLPFADYLEGRFMIVKKAEMFPVECIVRGYLAGSGLKEYQRQGSVCGIALEDGLVNSDKLPTAIFTPSTKAELGDHDENISYARCVELIGEDDSEELNRLSLQVYNAAADYARERGIIIADTKFEFGKIGGDIVLADEALTPDSSRFWSAETYEPGKSQASFDKQIVRDWLTDNWDMYGDPPHLPAEIIEQTSQKYVQVFEMITGKKFPYA